MVQKSSLFAGFTELPSEDRFRPGKTLLVPLHIHEAIRCRQDLGGTPTAKPAVPAKHLRPPPPATPTQATGPNDLATLRLDPQHDLADAKALVARILAGHLTGLDRFSAKFCAEFMTATALRHAHSTENTWDYVLKYPVDPDWDSPKQIISDLLNIGHIQRCGEANLWITEAMRPVQNMPEDSLGRLIRRCHEVWVKAIAALDANNTKPPKTRRTKPPASIPVFPPDAMAKAFSCVEKMEEKIRQQAERGLQLAQDNDGQRLLPNTRKAAKNLEQLSADFENLAEPIQHLQTQLALAGAIAPAEFRIAPMLLLGDPGIGKTHLALQLANALGVPMDKISAGNAQGGFQLTGSHASWNRAMAGSVFTLLSTGNSAAPVMVIDEVDKIGDGQYPLLPVLLDLLEHGTAKEFRDTFYDLEFDASRIIFILTANDLAEVPAPLLSRMSVFHVPRPQPAQRLRIIEGELASLRTKTRKRIVLDATSHELAERVDMDLRQTLRLVHEAFTRAMMAGSTTATLRLPAPAGRRPVGFVSRVA